MQSVEYKDQSDQVYMNEYVKPAKRTPDKKAEDFAGKYGKIAIVIFCVLLVATVGGLAAMFALHFESQGTWNRETLQLRNELEDAHAETQRLRTDNDRIEGKMNLDTLQLRNDIEEIGRTANTGYIDLDAKYQQLQEKNSNDTLQLRSDIDEIRRTANIGMCEVRYGDYCFFVGAKGPNTMNMNAARWFCKRNNATLGNIYSSEHFNMLTNYYRPYVGTLLNGATLLGLKTGMLFDTKTRFVHLSEGSRAPFIRWETGQPTTESQNSFIVVHINADERKASDGYVNFPEEATNFGALCQRRV